jgi:hypothetical protein
MWHGDDLATARREIARYGADAIDGAILIPDASVLLRLYECGGQERERILEALSSYGGRIWIPHRTRDEVLRRLRPVRTRNRISAVHVAKVIPELLDRAVQGLERRRDIVKAYDPSSLLKLVLERAEREIIAGFENEVRRAEAESFAGADRFLNVILSENHVGDPLPDHERERLIRTAPNRFAHKVPPGFEDFYKIRNRSAEAAFGDLIFWEEILRFASSRLDPILIVTAEEKADWWDRSTGFAAPHGSMIQEMHDRAGHALQILRLADFVSVRISWPDALVLMHFVDAVSQLDGAPHRSAILPLHTWVASFGAKSPLHDILGRQTDIDKWVASFGAKSPLHDILGRQTDIDKWVAGFGAKSPLHDILGRQTDIDKWVAGFGAKSPLHDILGRQTDIDKWVASFGAASRTQRAMHLDNINRARDDTRQRLNERVRQRRAIAKKSGLCSRCFRQPASPPQNGRTYATCGDCRSKRR